MVKYSLRKFDMAQFKASRNKCWNQGKIYLENMKGIKEGHGRNIYMSKCVVNVIFKKNNEGIMVMLRKEESGIKDKNRKIM